MRTRRLILAFACSLMLGQVPGYLIGRCVRVLGVTAPEDARKVGFEYLELALQDLLPLDDSEFDRVVKRLKAIGIPLVSGYGFLPPKLHVAGPGVDWTEVDA